MLRNSDEEMMGSREGPPRVERDERDERLEIEFDPSQLKKKVVLI